MLLICSPERRAAGVPAHCGSSPRRQRGGVAFSSVLSRFRLPARATATVLQKRNAGQSPVRMFKFNKRYLEALADALIGDMPPAFNATQD